jgi:Zn-dependent protease with chaperone function
MRRALLLLLLVASVSGCALLPSTPEGAYFPEPSSHTTVVANTLYRAAQAAGDDPARYSFALVKTKEVSAFSGDEDAVFYFSDGLAALPARHLDSMVAREVAHEVLGHAGKRRALSLSITGTFTVVGFIVPGLSLADWVVNPLIVRAFSRDQEIDADRRAVEILRSMGHELPRRTLAEALRAVEAAHGVSNGGWLAVFPALADRLAAIGPLEPMAELAQQK